MKTLFLLRHAKSSWDDPELKDFERPLSDRGLNDVPAMAQRFLQRHEIIDCIVASPSIRTKTTAKIFAECIEFSQDDVVSNPELYFAGANMFLKAASLVDEHCASAMLVGHNPAITEFVNAMVDANIDNIPTCGLVELSLPIDNWSDIQLGEASLIQFDYPKKAL